MQRVAGVRFDSTPKVYWFSAEGVECGVGDKVIVETARGVEIGVVRTPPEDVADEKIVSPLKPVLRVATEQDLARHAEHVAKKPEVLAIAAEKIAARKLKMKLVDAQYTIDGAKLVLYFTSESRVDFRELVKDLASAFRTRIELRQIGTRDECRMMGGFGPCGRECCCSSGCEFAKVNIRMAKNQNLSLNPGKISGLCGRLMCCLSYENAYYTEANKLLPKVGSKVRVEGENGEMSEGTATGVNQIRMTVKVRTENRDGTFDVADYPIEKVTRLDASSAADDVRVSKAEADELRHIED
ncbi:MAG TPA: stage 0 sporulation family protein [Candidatus Protoclostridium stercorigallinarum]|uniref:Stage 0 sporulation family protein n=1 Tax=Candidatus Protoclostridium stercorigallinarum TaxID=2838741 RepID=A0A9D1Q1R8_9FIRM|nr:stage 0 sporulation family protein [Candidatus Protoclostridium stercorigallinarum]